MATTMVIIGGGNNGGKWQCLIGKDKSLIAEVGKDERWIKEEMIAVVGGERK